MRRLVWLGAVLLGIGCQSVLAQREALPPPTPAALQALALRATLQQLLAPSHIVVPEQTDSARAGGAQELRLVWEPLAGAESVGRAAVGLRVISRIRDQGSFPRLRALELTEEKLLVVAIAADGVLRGWSVIQDPRFVRIEVPGPDGVLTGKTVAVSHAEFLALIPDDPTIVEIRLFHPRPAGRGFTLDLIATMIVPDGGATVQ